MVRTFRKRSVSRRKRRRKTSQRRKRRWSSKRRMKKKGGGCQHGTTVPEMEKCDQCTFLNVREDDDDKTSCPKGTGTHKEVDDGINIDGDHEWQEWCCLGLA